jgi:hypothetical protein
MFDQIDGRSLPSLLSAENINSRLQSQYRHFQQRLAHSRLLSFNGDQKNNVAIMALYSLLAD